jgi:hypothetical protein
LTEPFGTPYDNNLFSLLRQIRAGAHKRAEFSAGGIFRRALSPAGRPAGREKSYFRGFPSAFARESVSRMR